MRSSIALVPILLASAAVAQVNIIVPAAAATVKPTNWLSQIFYSTSSTTIPHDSHSQSIYDVAEFGAAPAPLQSVSVRRPVGLGNANPATTANVVITMSMSPLAYTAATTTFASNHGANIVTVFNGQVNLPAAANQPTWPAPWQTPIPFSSPFPFIPANGQTVVFDVMLTGNTATTPWYVEATPPDRGTRSENGGPQSNCKFSNGQYNSGLGYTLPFVGGSWRLTYSSILPNAPGFASIGFQGVGGVWNGFPLPIDLTPLGAPGCSYNIDPLFTVGIVASATGSASWPAAIPIPNDPTIGGLKFYDHSIWLDPLANAWGGVTGWSSTWTIGTNTGAPGAFLSATGASAGNPTGSLQMGMAPTLLFQ